MSYLVGIDEAGRGPLAGPVAVGIIAISSKSKNKIENLFKELKVGVEKYKDSKKLKEKERELIFQKIKKEKIRWSVNFGSVKEIDELGITHAIAKAMAWGLKKLKVSTKTDQIFLDGSLKAPSEFKNQETVIKGDEKNLLISLASICAKVTRDNLMKKNAKKYPKYGFELHKGYGTEGHRYSIKKYGLSEIHRVTFCKNLHLFK